MKDEFNLNQSRCVNFDLLKVLLMYGIVVFHVVSWGGVIPFSAPFSIKYEMARLIYTGLGCAVNTYAILTGYFGINKKIKYTNLILLWLRAVWYGALITLGFAIFKPEIVDFKSIILIIFPVTGRAYWYLTAYFMLFLFRPVLNTAVRVLDKVQLSFSIVLIVAVVCVPAMLNSDAFRMSKGFSPWWLMILYLVGGYIRKYGFMSRVKTKWLWSLYFLAIALDFVKCCIYDILVFSIRGELPFFEDAMNYMSLTMFIASVCILLIFERVKVQNGHMLFILPKLSVMSFSVYLIHVNHLVWDCLLTDRFKFLAEVNTGFSVIGVFALSAVIFLSCMVIDLPRAILFNRLKLENKFTVLENKISGFAGIVK